MKIEPVIKLLKKNYERALSIQWVHKPLSWALYQTWKAIDGMEKERKIDQEKHELPEENNHE